jgi:hypothetical protein
MLIDIRNAMNPAFFLPMTAASTLVDTAGMFVWRYMSKPTAPINQWYDKLGLAAYGADIFSLIIAVILAQLITTAIGGAWNPLIFLAVIVGVQMAHDIGFGTLLVPNFPAGKNVLMDLMKQYVGIKGAGGILVVDAIYCILAALLTMIFAGLPAGVSWITLMVTLYTTMFILYTRP